MAADASQLIYTLGVTPGIKRDGTFFDSREYSDGAWCRFQRGIPKKMGGYREMYQEPNGIPRGIISNAYNGINYVFTGTATNLGPVDQSVNDNTDPNRYFNNYTI